MSDHGQWLPTVLPCDATMDPLESHPVNETAEHPALSSATHWWIRSNSTQSQDPSRAPRRVLTSRPPRPNHCGEIKIILKKLAAYASVPFALALMDASTSGRALLMLSV